MAIPRRSRSRVRRAARRDRAHPRPDLRARGGGEVRRHRARGHRSSPREGDGMTARLSVFAAADADAADRIGQAVAALPVSLHPGDDGADLVGIAGDPGWVAAATAAIDRGARGVLVVDPAPEDVRTLRERRVPVVLDGRWTYNPAVLDSRPAFAARNDEESLVEARVDVPVGADLERVLLSQLALVRTAVAPVERLTFDRWNAHGYDARGTLASGARVALAAILTDALEPAASLRI